MTHEDDHVCFDTNSVGNTLCAFVRQTPSIFAPSFLNPTQPSLLPHLPTDSAFIFLSADAPRPWRCQRLRSARGGGGVCWAAACTGTDVDHRRIL